MRFRLALITGSLLLTTTAILSVQHTARGDAPVVDVAGFLSDYSAVRAARMAAVRADAEHKSALERQNRDDQLYRMDQSLFDQNAVSQEDLDISAFRSAASAADVERAASAASALWSAHDVNVLEMNASGGAALDLQALYAAYRREWDAQCTETEAAHRAADAAVTLRQAQLARAERLYPDRAVSYTELLEARTQAAMADNDLAAAVQNEHDCKSDIPDLPKRR
jgi:hypothetical protein